MFHTLNDVGKKLTVNWGWETEKNLSEFAGSIDDERGIKCLLSYIGHLLKPISEVAQWQIDAKEQKRREELEKDREKRMIIAKPLRVKLKEMRKLSDDKAYNRILDGISNLICGFEFYDIDWYLEEAKQIIEKPITEWQEKELLGLNGIGKKRLADFLEWKASQPKLPPTAQ